MFSLIYFVLVVLLAVWVYQDAANRKRTDGAIWAIVVFLVPVAILLYLYLRERT